jgi:16S rRNA (guanine966-N2)-methyltransferase
MLPPAGILRSVARPRIFGGSARGRPLSTPRSGTRPTPGRVREALFDILAFEPRGVFLDLYAGSGALGLEAASRGWRAVCVDLGREANEVIRRNARDLGLDVDVRRGDALAVARTLRGEIDVCSAAPPYPDDLTAIFQALLDSGCVRPGGRYVFQHPTGRAPRLLLGGAPAPIELRRYGSNALTIVRIPTHADRAHDPPTGRGGDPAPS